jgi:energy-coupling factor transporter ATP-binding protein EcfA2
MHFTEHLVTEFKKPTRVQREPKKLESLIRQLKNETGFFLQEPESQLKRKSTVEEITGQQKSSER